jgi:hypothetical protein
LTGSSCGGLGDFSGGGGGSSFLTGGFGGTFNDRGGFGGGGGSNGMAGGGGGGYTGGTGGGMTYTGDGFGAAGGSSFLNFSAAETSMASGVRRGYGEIDITLVPEPSAPAWVGLGFISLILLQRRRNRQY